MNGILGRKVGMTQVFTEDGRAVPVTVVEAGPCTVTAVKNPERDGYAAVQLAFGYKRRLNKPRLGHARKATGNNDTRPRVLREFRGGIEGAELGQRVTVDMVFAKDDYVDVTATSKGKGFQGGMKRWNFRGGPKTHGQSDRHRAPGSVGAGTTPGRTLKGQKMAGHMGHRRSTVQNLQVIAIDPENHVLLIKGAVPGPANGTVMVRRAVKKYGSAKG
jgi:large subunit ribosomal protein L3